MKKYNIYLLLIVLLFSCKKENIQVYIPEQQSTDISQYKAKTWDKVKRGGVYYEIFVRSFADGNADGIGDLKGITNKLDYLNDLGISGIWLTPINKSPSYHGYDVDDYTSINPDFGSMSDFEAMLSKAHSLGIKIILDLVVNHTSKTNIWFTTAIKSQTNQFRDYYIFAPTSQVSSLISQGKVPMTNNFVVGQWHSIGQGTTGDSYLGMFSESMPDLNYGPVASCETNAVFKEIVAAAKFWISKGVDGFRLDAVKHIYQNEDSNENPIFLEKLTSELKKSKPDLYIVGENLTGDYTKVAPYYKGLPALFNFDAWYKLIYAIENSHAKWFPKDIIDMENLFKQIRIDAIDVTKLSNHDEDRTLSVFNGDKAKAKMAAAVLLTISNNPYIYYGEEIGMIGLKSQDDKNVREPFLWSSYNGDIYRTKWFTPNNSNDATVSPLNHQVDDITSVYRVYKKFIELRNSYTSLAQGTITLPLNFDTCSKNFMAFYRESMGEKLLVIHNVSSNYATYVINHDVKNAIADMGKVNYTKLSNNTVSVIMPAYSTIIFEL